MRGKLQRRVRSIWVRQCCHRPWYPALYRSYWHARWAGAVAGRATAAYYTAVPHPGAGIGHQLANWIAGYWFARQFGLRFAHTPFADPAWERFLGFGADEVSVADLRQQGFRLVRLPLFAETDPRQVQLQQRIIQSYGSRPIVFVAEQDQSYRDQFGVQADLQRKFHSAAARQGEHLRYSAAQFNIALHVRRGDIATSAAARNPHLQMRWQGEPYFERVLEQVLGVLPSDWPVAIYLFSQGDAAQFARLAQRPEVQLCLDLDDRSSFLHMVQADLLITSKSSFSYKPALLSRGLKISPRDFWHGYPQSADWILAEADGSFPCEALQMYLDSHQRQFASTHR